MKAQLDNHLKCGLVIVSVGLFLLATSATAQEEVGLSSPRLTTSKNVINWVSKDNKIPVCWETNGYDREKYLSQRAIALTWEFYSKIQFIGWNSCPTSGTAQYVRIRINPNDGSDAGAGGSARMGTDALSSAVDNNPGVNLSFNPDSTADVGRVEYVAVHEFGHVMGFIHEQDAPGNEGPAKCVIGLSAVDEEPVSITPYDPDSIMNYCNKDGNMKGYLTETDMTGSQTIYGVNPRYTTITSSSAISYYLIK